MPSCLKQGAVSQIGPSFAMKSSESPSLICTLYDSGEETAFQTHKDHYKQDCCKRLCSEGCAAVLAPLGNLHSFWKALLWIRQASGDSAHPAVILLSTGGGNTSPVTQ